MARESSVFVPKPRARHLAVVAAAVLLGLGAYLLSAARTYRLGFPLDDSWIHAVFARNFSLHGQWAFRLGHPSAGSTSPLWTFLLVPGFWLRLEPLWWSYLLGAVLLLALGLLMESLARRLLAAYSPRLPWVALFFVCEWHMQWAAVSGMETMLDAFLLSVVAGLLLVGSRHHFQLGVLTGIATWVRPDALTLLAPACLVLLLAPGPRRDRAGAVAAYLVGVAALLVPYLLLNAWLSGNPLPNTFYAKQAEYAAWQSQPILRRFVALGLQLIAGPAVLLVPALLVAIPQWTRERNTSRIVVLGWCVGYLVLYVLRLPPYQHGRYLMPAMPTFFLLGLLGLLELRRGRSGSRNRQMLEVGSVWGLALLAVGFTVLGARAYGQDVAFIESEMVDTADWVASNIPPGAVIAAHDIGALGYFDHHDLVDLAGLVSPEVVPFIRDQARLADYLDARNVEYFIAFPSLYPDLAAKSRAIFSSGGAFAPTMGGENMTVYCWRCR